MGLVSGLAVFFIVWWLVFFAVLPFGARSQVDEDEVILGTERGAPAHPALGRKMLITTGIAAVIFLGIFAIFGILGFTLEDFVI